MGCVSESSIAIGPQYSNRSRRANSTSPRIPEDEEEEEEEYEDDEESLSDENSKSPSNIFASPKFQRLLKNFKKSQLFVYKDEDAEEDDMGMEIGFPTDVKHVTHIEIDGSSTSILSSPRPNPHDKLHLTKMRVIVGQSCTHNSQSSKVRILLIPKRERVIMAEFGIATDVYVPTN